MSYSGKQDFVTALASLSKTQEQVPEEPQAQNDEAEVEEEEEGEDSGVLFYVNKGGFPINEKTWERMWDHVSRIHPDGSNMVSKVREVEILPEVPVPQPPINFPLNMTVPDRLEIIQKYMNDLQYNHTGTQFFEIRKSRPISGLNDTAKEIIRESLPIKCLEAVILAIYLTNGMPGLDRFPVSFKTTFAGHVHRHVVLGVYYMGKYGALGMSRREDLMDKPLVYRSLSLLVIDFQQSYEKYFHEVKKVKVGLPVSHDPHSYEHIQWKYLSLNLGKVTKEEMRRELDRHGRECKSKMKSLGSTLSPRKPAAGPALSLGVSSSPRKDAGPSVVMRQQIKAQKSSSPKEKAHKPGPVKKKVLEATDITTTTDYQIRI